MAATVACMEFGPHYNRLCAGTADFDELIAKQREVLIWKLSLYLVMKSRVLNLFSKQLKV